MAVCFGAWSWATMNMELGRPSILLTLLLFFLAVGGPFLALGTLFGRTWLGAAAAAVFAISIIAIGSLGARL
jgi:hypothetical protein